MALSALVCGVSWGGLVWWQARISVPDVERLVAMASSEAGSVRLSSAAVQLPEEGTRGWRSEPERWKLLAAAARVEEAARRDPSAANLHALGVATLLLDEPFEAVRILRRAIEAAPRDSRIATDLGAALIHLGRIEAEPARIAEGVDVLLGIPPRRRSAAVLFDLALGQEELGLRAMAIEAWESYLSLDPSSKWREEAELRLARARVESRQKLSAEVLEREVIDEALAAWIAAAPGRDRRHELLDRALRGALRYRERFEDPFLERLVLAGSNELRGDGAPAVRAYIAARAAYAAGDLERCARETAMAFAGPEAIAIPAMLTGASCDFLRSDVGAAEAAARAVEERLAASAQRSPVLASQAAWVRGLVAHATTRPVEAFAHFDRALSGFEASGDCHRVVAVRSLRADLLVHLGRVDEAWREDASAVGAPCVSPTRRYQLQVSLVNLARRMGLPELARHLAMELPAAAEAQGDPTRVVEAWSLVAGFERERGDEKEAAAALARAAARIQEIDDRSLRGRAEALVAAENAELRLHRDPAGALRELQRLRGFEAANGDLYLRVATLRAEALLRMLEVDAAEAEIRQALRRSDIERATLASLAERDQLFLAREAIHHRLVRLLADQGRAEEALQVLDRWRSEPFPALRAHRVVSAGSPTLDGVTVLVFLSMDDELLTWRVGAGEIRLARRAVSRSELEALVDASRREARDRVTGAGGRRLAQLLFEDFTLGREHTLLIVPDATLFAVPFAALANPHGEVPFGKQVGIEVSPSLGVWSERRASVAPSDCVLVIRGAASGGVLFPELAVLERLDEEVEAVRAGHPCGEIVDSPEDLTAALGRRRWAFVHYAGHTVGTQAGAALLLEEQGSVVPFEAERLAEAPLIGALVVLGSCSSADGRPSPTAGRDGLARAALAAGARAVVASLWDVGDAEALEVGVAVHRAIAAGRRVDSRLLDEVAGGGAAWMVVGSAVGSRKPSTKGGG